MATVIRPEISEKNKYWIDRHRHYELKHFCLQYPNWKRAYSNFNNAAIPLSMIDNMPTSNMPGDPTAKRVLMKTYFLDRIELIENTAKEADRGLHTYILKGVTEGLSYTYLKTILKIPCSRDTYYDRYRRFFWLLNQARK